MEFLHFLYRDRASEPKRAHKLRNFWHKEPKQKPNPFFEQEREPEPRTAARYYSSD